MSSVCLITSRINETHFFPGHPERPERLNAIEEWLGKTGLSRDCAKKEATPATPDDILRAHTSAHFHEIAATSGQVGGFDPDTYYTGDTYEAAMLAAGATIDCVREVMEGRVDRALALVRPPGHHATPSQSMGFCHFNNVSVAARFAQKEYGFDKVAIIDFDVHHGNGTQDIFYEDPSVFFFSMHQHPLWPMSGTREECGKGRGKGTTLNIPLAPGTTGAECMEDYERALDKVFAFKPEFVFISAGFDSHRADPLASLLFETEDFEKLTDLIVQRCDSNGVRGIVSTLEGGYHLQALAESVEVHLRSLMDR